MGRARKKKKVREEGLGEEKKFGRKKTNLARGKGTFVLRSLINILVHEEIERREVYPLKEKK